MLIWNSTPNAQGWRGWTQNATQLDWGQGQRGIVIAAANLLPPRWLNVSSPKLRPLPKKTAEEEA